MKAGDVTQEMREAMCWLRDRGHSLRSVGRYFGCDHQTVAYHTEYAVFKRKRLAGRKNKKWLSR